MSISSFSYVGLVPEHLNASIINMWTQDNIHPAQFYRTGFETIFFNHNPDFAIECVLSSVVPDDKEIVIAGTGKLDTISAVAEKYNVSNIVFNAATGDLNLVETFLCSCKNVSHLVLVIGNDGEKIENCIRSLLPVLQHKNIELVLICSSSVQRIHERSNGGVDYMIGGWDDIPDNSFVVARRNKLVQIEGNSKSLIHDLYASWQCSLLGRESNIAHMEM